jgi:hypothetical protein
MDKAAFKEANFVELERRFNLSKQRLEDAQRQILAQDEIIQRQKKELDKQELFIVQIRKELIARL